MGRGRETPSRPKLSPELRRREGWFQRAVSGSKEDLLKDHGNFPSIAQGLALDDGSFELVSVSDEEDWELIMNEEMLRMNVNDNDDDDNEGEGEGEDSGVAATQSEAAAGPMCYGSKVLPLKGQGRELRYSSFGEQAKAAAAEALENGQGRCQS